MNKFLKIIGLAFVLLTGVFLYACGAVTTTPKINVDKSYLELRIDEEGKNTEFVDVILTDYKDSALLGFSTDNRDLITYSSEYIGNGKTRLKVTGVQPGTAWLTITSLQGGATKNLEIKVISPIRGIKLDNEHKNKIHAIRGSTLNLNDEKFYNFIPEKTNEKELDFEIITPDSGCVINNGILSVSNSALNKITIKAKSKNNESVKIEGFDVYILQPISSVLEAGYEVANQIIDNTNNVWDLYVSDPIKSSIDLVLTITAGSEDEKLIVSPIFNSEKFSVSQTNYNFINGSHQFAFTVQTNSLDAGKEDQISFKISYEDFSVGEDAYAVMSESLKISSYNSPEFVRVNQGMSDVDLEVFENSQQLINGRQIELSILPDNIKKEQSYIRIWTLNLASSPIYLYKMNDTRSGYILLYGLDSARNLVCSNRVEATDGARPYLEIKSGEKLYAFANSNYNAQTNKSATFYTQAAVYYENSSIEEQRAFTKINFTINPNSKAIYLADESDGSIVARRNNDSQDNEINLDINNRSRVEQYIAIEPSDFVVGSSSTVTISNTNLATVSNLISVSKDSSYVYAKFTINLLSLGSTTIKISLSDGKSKTFTLNIASSLEELEIRLEDLNNQIDSDILAFTNIGHTIVRAVKNPEVQLNKVSIANSGSGIQFIKRASPYNAQYYLDYGFCDYDFTGDDTIENITMTASDFEATTFEPTSNILNVDLMKYFSIIQPVNSKTEGTVILRINVYGVSSSGTYQPVGSIYYMINFFIPVSGLRITNSTLELQPYYSIGDKAIDLSRGSFSVAVNSANGGVNPTYIDTLQVYVNNSLSGLDFVNNACYLDEDGDWTDSFAHAVLKITREKSGGVYHFNVQAYKKTSTNFVFAFVITEVHGRKITGVARVFIADVTEIEEIEIVNINKDKGIYFQNKDNSNEKMSIELMTNLLVFENKSITNDNLYFEFNFTEMYEDGDSIDNVGSLVQIERLENGNYKLTVKEAFSGRGRIIIYPESDFFNSGRDESGPYLEIPILIADGTEALAIRISNEKDIELLDDSSLHFSLNNNLSLGSANIKNFKGKLYGNNYTISVQGPLFRNIESGAEINGLNIIARPETYVQAVGYAVPESSYIAFGFFACLNEGKIVDVNIDASTTHLKISDSNINAIGLLVGVNKGSITYTVPAYSFIPEDDNWDEEYYESGDWPEDWGDYDPEEFEEIILYEENSKKTVNIYGDISNIIGSIDNTDAGKNKYVGGVVGFDEGSITKTRVDIQTSDNEHLFSGNESNGKYADEKYNDVWLGSDRCAVGGIIVEEFDVKLNPKGLSEENLIGDVNQQVLILYHYNVIGASLNDNELSELKEKNTLNFEDLFSFIRGEDSDSYDYSDFRFSIEGGKKNVAEIFGDNLILNGVGKIELTITPKYSDSNISKKIYIYVIYPINSYSMHEGINTEAYSKITANKTISVKKSGEVYLTSSFDNKIALGYASYTISQNSLALGLSMFKNNDEEVNDTFTFSGGSADNNFFSAGTISVAPKDVDLGSEYKLLSRLALQQTAKFTGDELEELNTLLLEKFSKTIKFDIYVGAEKIGSNINYVEIDPSTVQSVDIKLTTDKSNDSLGVEIRDLNNNIIELNNSLLSVSPRALSDEKFEVLIYVKEDKRIEVTSVSSYVVYIYAESEKEVYLTITVTVKPQGINSVTYSHYNRDDRSIETGLVPQKEPSSVLAPGDSGLLVLNIFPTYAAYSKIVIESEIQNGNYVLLEQMYLDGGQYFSTSGKKEYNSSRNVNVLTIKNSEGLKSSEDGMVYIRTKILMSAAHGASYPLTVKIYKENENGEEVLIKSEQIHLVSRAVDGPLISINGEKEAVAVRGFNSEIKISVPDYQDLSNYSIQGHGSGDDSLDRIEPYIDRANYEIVNGRKIFTGRLSIGLNAEIYDDGKFEVVVIVSRIINGRIETATDKIEVRVVDFLVEGLYIDGNNEEDNVFDTPLAIEKELKFKFILSDLPSYYNSLEERAVTRIRNARQYFLDHMAYKYEVDEYSYIINTDRTFIKSTTDTSTPKSTTHIVPEQAPDSIAYNLYYTNSMQKYIGNESNQYIAIRYDGYNENGVVLDMESNLLRVTGTRTGNIQLTVRIPYKLPNKTSVSYISYNFVINVQIYSDEDKPTPIYNEAEFMEYLSSQRTDYNSVNYILMNDLTLRNYNPLETTYFNSLDGNNKIITIASFNPFGQENSNMLNLGLFRQVASNSTLKNITLSLYELEDIIIDENQFITINIAGIAVDNYGVIYNCEVIALDRNGVGGRDADAGIRVYFDEINKEKLKRFETEVTIAGLVVNNHGEGCITNSRVGGYTFFEVTGNNVVAVTNSITHKNINIIGQGDIAGFVAENKGVISASYFANGRIINNSTSGAENITSGFVITNEREASIHGSYSKGIKLSSDLGSYITGGGISAKGIVAGFVYLNEGHITDSYTNIKLSGLDAGIIVSGFVYHNRNNGLLERCYSAATIVGGLTTQMPFTGKDNRDQSLQEVENGLVSCYYIVKTYSSDAALENEYDTGAEAISVATLTKNKLYGFSFVSGSEAQDGSWHWTGVGAELIEANNIAISSRYAIEDYNERISGGSTIESLDIFPYIKGYEYGSAKNPIIIRNADEYNRVFGQETSLRPGAYYAISQMYDKSRGVIFGNYRLVSHIDFQELSVVENIKITSSIMNLSKKGEYRGVFDGNGLTISNIEITLKDQQVVGLISKLSNSAVLKNVNLRILKVATSEKGVYVGGAVGQVENSFMSNVSVVAINTDTGSNKSSVSGYNMVGGVVGFVIGKSRLTNITSAISVNSLYKNSIEEYERFGKSMTDHKLLSYAGGVIGLIDTYVNILDSGVYTSTPSVSSLKFYGKNVSVQGKFVGGITGYIGISTYLVDALFEITGRPSDSLNQKLISYGDIESKSSTIIEEEEEGEEGIEGTGSTGSTGGNESSVESKPSAIGGLVGVNYGDLFEIRIEHERDTQKVIEDSLDGHYNRNNPFRGIGNLFNGIEETTTVQYMGGLVGKMMKGNLRTSYSKVDVVSENAMYAGGILGYNGANVEIFEIFAFGDVDAKKKENDALVGKSGGIVGYNKGNLKLSQVVAMNFYNKNHSEFEGEPDEKGEVSPFNLSPIVGEDAKNLIEYGARVYAVKDIKLSENKTIKLDFSATEATTLTITHGDIGQFSANIDTLTTNQMFLDAEWDLSLWVKDEDRIFPHLGFGLENLILYIEKPSDFANIEKYSKQSNEIVIGDDPNTLFSPYKYVKDDPMTHYGFEKDDLEGLSVDGDTLIFDLSDIKFGNASNENAYFTRFLGRLYGESRDKEYIIEGLEKSFFEEIIGGEVSNIVFDLEDSEITGSVLAQEISSDTKLSNLTFKNVIIESGNEKVGILASSFTNVSRLENITIKDCSIITSTSVEEDVYVGGVVGDSDNYGTISSYRMTLDKVHVEGLSIKVGNAKNAYVGMIFGKMTFQATYLNCKVEGEDFSNIIEVSAVESVYVGGFAGSTGETQTLRALGYTNPIENLYILVENAEKLYAGLLFGEASMHCLDQGITLSGVITNRYSFENGEPIEIVGDNSVVAYVGGIVGSGSGEIKGITVKGIEFGDNKNERIIDLYAKGENIEGPGQTEYSLISEIGGAIGVATKKLTLVGVNIEAEVYVKSASSEIEILIIGGLVGNIENEFEIRSSNFKSNIEIETNRTLYTGGIVGYVYTETSSPGEYILDGNGFEGQLNISEAKKIYAGGIIGTSSDAIIGIKNKLEIIGSEVSGNIKILNAANSAELYIGGVAGSIVADMKKNYAWGNITIDDNIENPSTLYIGGIAAIIKGLSTDKSKFNSNHSLTSIYNKRRAEDHQVRALIAQATDIFNGEGEDNENFYCHQINLCVDVIGTNLAYNSNNNMENESQTIDNNDNMENESQTILDKFKNAKNADMESVSTKFENTAIGSKLNPEKIKGANYSSIDIEEAKYYVLTGRINASNAKDVKGHLVGDGYKVKNSGSSGPNSSPFGDIEGFVSGISTISERSDNTAIGFASKNTGIIFACTALVGKVGKEDDRRTIHCGFVYINEGFISDCGAVLYGKKAGTGFCTLNSGIIVNSYATGSLTEGVIDHDSTKYKRALFAGSSGTETEPYSNKGTIINCYVSLKASTSSAAFYGATTNNCYYDKNAAEKESFTEGAGAAKTTEDMSTITQEEGSINNSGFLDNSADIWGQNFKYNFGYPTMSTGAYEGFTYLFEFADTGNGDLDNLIQIPNAGKMQQINDDAYSLKGNYQLVNNLNITKSNLGAWTPIGKNGNSFTGSFNGSGYNIEITSISNVEVTAGKEGIGLFGNSSGVIENFKLEFNFNASNTDANYIGGVVAYMKGGTVEDITVSSAQSTNNVKGGSGAVYIGGIVAYIKDEGTVSGNTNERSFNATISGSRLGGIVGTANGSDIEINKNSNSADLDTSALDGRLGGIIGVMASGSVDAYNSNTGKITGTQHVGGIAGYVSEGAEVSGTNSGNIEGTQYVGGIVGYVPNGTISGTNYAQVTVNKTSGTENIYAGGIVGRINAGTVSSCTNSGDVTAGKNKGVKGITPYAGGIVGYRAAEVTVDGSNVNNTPNVIITAYGYYYKGEITPDSSYYPTTIKCTEASKGLLTFIVEEEYEKIVYKVCYAGKIIGNDAKEGASGNGMVKEYGTRFSIPPQTINAPDPIVWPDNWEKNWELSVSGNYYKTKTFPDGQGKPILGQHEIERVSIKWKEDGYGLFDDITNIKKTAP